jgi:hypothetical protein
VINVQDRQDHSVPETGPHNAALGDEDISTDPSLQCSEQYVANNRAETQFLAVRTFRMFNFEDFPPVPE